jgi:pyruvate dehydrogenase E1 component alpha subunit
MYVEFDTYRYHGHSMSDPGTTYRTRDEVGSVREARDPIEYVKKLLLDYKLMTAEEIKDIEKNIRNSVQESLVAAKAGRFPPDNWLYEDIYSNNQQKNETPEFIRMPDYHKSIGAKL